MKAIADYNLEIKVAGSSADKSNTNVGCLLRRYKNVLTKIKSQLNRNIIDFGFDAHIIHNCARKGIDSMPVHTE
jgi:hypothetical protein